MTRWLTPTGSPDFAFAYDFVVSDHEKVCAKCDYDLIGLPDLGQCPECGSFYNHRTGEGCKPTLSNSLPASGNSRAERILKRIRTLFFAGLTALLLVLGFLLALFDARATALSMCIGTILVCGLCALTSYVYEKD